MATTIGRLGLVLVVGSSAHVGLETVGPSRADAAEALRCGGRLVGEGATALELRTRCGPPDHIASRPVLEASGFETPRRGRVVRRPGGQDTIVLAPPTVRRVRYTRELVETWLYASERGRLPRLVTLRRGKVHRIETLGPLDLEPDEGCARALHTRGTRVGVVHLSCGAPDDRAVWEEEEELEVNGVIRRRLVVHERWTYDPGPGRLIRILEFENARLTKVETGARAP